MSEPAPFPLPTESQRRRVLTSFAIGLLAGLIVAAFAPWQLAVLAAWDVVALLMLTRVWARVHSFTPEQTMALATFEDDSRPLAELMLLNASVASLVGVAFGIVKANQTHSGLHPALTSISVLTVVLSWAVVHTVYMLRYAHEYYTPPVGGIDYKSGDYEPDYRDFAYVAFTIGMTFQVSDTDVNRREIRRTVLVHALISYLFGAVILALLVNVIAGWLNR
jgi:uncharacterized membrane protein